jgi:hypothetical protein
VRESGGLDFSLTYAVASVVAFAASWGGLSVAWTILAFGGVDAEHSVRWLRSQIWRYVPGAVWAPMIRFAGMVGDRRYRGTLLAAESLAILGVGSSIGGAVAAVTLNPLWFIVVVAGLIGTGIAVWLVHRIAKAALMTIGWIAVVGVSMALYLIGSGCAQLAVGPGVGFWEAGAAGMIAWCAGFVVFFAPGGVGAKEWAYVAVLGTFASATVSAGVIAARLFFLAAEGALLFVALIIGRHLSVRRRSGDRGADTSAPPRRDARSTSRRVARR